MGCGPERDIFEVSRTRHFWGGARTKRALAGHRSSSRHDGDEPERRRDGEGKVHRARLLVVGEVLVHGRDHLAPFLLGEIHPRDPRRVGEHELAHFRFTGLLEPCPEDPGQETGTGECQKKTPPRLLIDHREHLLVPRRSLNQDMLGRRRLR
jgi:hypothetical protein